MLRIWSKERNKRGDIISGSEKDIASVSEACKAVEAGCLVILKSETSTIAKVESLLNGETVDGETLAPHLVKAYAVSKSQYRPDQWLLHMRRYEGGSEASLR